MIVYGAGLNHDVGTYALLHAWDTIGTLAEQVEAEGVGPPDEESDGEGWRRGWIGGFPYRTPE